MFHIDIVGIFMICIQPFTYLIPVGSLVITIKPKIKYRLRAAVMPYIIKKSPIFIEYLLPHQMSGLYKALESLPSQKFAQSFCQLTAEN